MDAPSISAVFFSFVVDVTELEGDGELGEVLHADDVFKRLEKVCLQEL